MGPGLQSTFSRIASFIQSLDVSEAPAKSSPANKSWKRVDRADSSQIDRVLPSSRTSASIN